MNNKSSFDNGLKHSNNYANYGVDKIGSKKERNNDKPNQNKQILENSVNKLTSIQEDIFSGNLTDNIDKVVVETVTAPNQDSHQRLKTAAVIGTSMLGVGALTLVFTKGKLSKKAVKSLGKIIDNATIKIDELKQKPTISHIEGIHLKVLQKTNDFASRIRGAFFNITPLKDVLFSKIVKQKLGLKKPCNAITNGFRKLSFSTVESSYAKAGENIDNLTYLFTETNTKIAHGEFAPFQKIPHEDVLHSMEDKIGLIRTSFISNFNPTQLDYRNTLLINKFKGLDRKVYGNVYGNIKDFVSDFDEWTSFVSERIVAKDKAKIMNDLSERKKIITNNPSDNYNKMSDILTKLNNSINPHDKDSRNTVKTLRTLTERYINLSGPQENSDRKDIVKLINTHLKKAIKLSISETYSPKQAKKISSLYRQFGEIINTDKKGAVEQLLTLYKQYLPKHEYLKLKTQADKTIKSLNKAVNIEGNEYVDKARDLACGSALTDVAIGMSLPLATTSLAMASAKTKEKKRSVALKYGLPLVAGISASTIATLKLISGGKALILGSAVSILSNELFERLDNYLIKRDTKKTEG